MILRNFYFNCVETNNLYRPYNQTTTVRDHYGDEVLGDLLTALSEDLQFAQKFILNEHHLYGSSRLGVKTHKRVLLRKEFSISGFEEDGTYITDEVTDSLVYVASSEYFCRVLAQKQYELSNHLGNVLATVLDRKTGVYDPTEDTLMYYNADVVNATLYYPFGQAMLSYKNEEYNFAYGLNGQEKEDDIFEGAYSAEYWMYDSRLGRRWNNDPRPNPSVSVYACFGNNPIWFSDVAGDTIKTFGVEEEKLLNDYNTLIDNQIQAHQNEIEQLTNEILGGNLTNEQIQTKTELIVQKQIVLDKWLEVRKELNELEISTDVYMIRLGGNVSQNLDGADGNFVYNPTTKQFDVNVVGGNIHSFQLTDLQILGHELKHGYQFHNKQFAFSTDVQLFLNNKGSVLGLTQNHEIEAHKRQQLIFNATQKGYNIKNVNSYVGKHSFYNNLPSEPYFNYSGAYIEQMKRLSWNAGIGYIMSGMSKYVR